MSDPCTLGLIAGAGALPGQALQRLREREPGALVFGFEGITDPAIVPADQMTTLGQLRALEAQLARRDVRRLLILGKFDRALLESPDTRLTPDDAALSLLARIRDQGDVDLMAAIAAWLEERGYSLCAQDELLEEMLAKPGLVAGRAPTAAEFSDFEVGRDALSALGGRAAGQAVAVARGIVVATESGAGTDAMIRGLATADATGAVLVKAARPGQDRRLDLPTIGPGTIEAMRLVGASALAVEAGSTFVVDGARVQSLSKAAALSVWAFDAAGGRS